MAKLSYKRRESLPAKDFAVKGRHYPIDTANRARNALTRVSQFGSSTQKAAVRRKVKAKYPGIAISGLKKGKGKGRSRKRISAKR